MYFVPEFRKKSRYSKIFIIFLLQRQMSAKLFWLPMTTEPYPRIISLIPSPTMLQSMKELRVQIYEHLLLPTGTLKQGLIKTIVRKMKLITKPYQKIG